MPGADVIVHVEPQEAEAIRERAYAAALRDPRVREVHNIVVLEVGGRTEVSLHLKLPGGYFARGGARGRARRSSTRSSTRYRTWTPCRRTSSRWRSPQRPRSVPDGERAAETEALRRIVVEATGAEPRELRLLNTEVGLVAFLTLAMDASRPLSPRRMRSRATSRSASGGRIPGSPTSSSTPSRSAFCRPRAG